MSALCVRIDARAGDAGRIGTLVNYVTEPEKENKNERIIAVQTGNIFAEQRMQIIAEMRETADQAKAKDNKVSYDPFEHFVISFAETDAVTVADFNRARDVALKHLGMEQHQYISAIHGDTDNLHMHLIVSRIDPETLDAKTIPYPVKQAEQIGARINHELCMSPLENNRYRVNERGDIERLQQTAVAQPDQLRDIIKGARSWQEFHQRTQEIGINYERKGSGALINGEKASDVDRNASLAKLVKKFGEYEEYKPSNEAKTKQPTQQLQEKLNDSKFNAKPDLAAREIFAGHSLRKLSECNLAQSKGWKSTSLLQDNARFSEREPSGVRRSIHQERAEQREQQRVALADKQRSERTQVFDKFKERKRTLMSDKSLPHNAKIALSSVLAAEQAKELAEVRARQKQERAEQRKQLNNQLPLQTDRQKPSNEFTLPANAQVNEVKHKDIRDFKHDVTSAGVEYAKDENARADFIDRGRRIEILNSKDDASVLAALQLAQVKFGKQLHVYGSDEFKAKAVQIAVANNIQIANPELQSAISVEKERLQKERLAVQNTKYEARNEFEKLADAVGADRWRVTLGSYTDKDKTSVVRDETAPALNEGSGKGNDGLSVEQVKAKWGYINFCQQNDETKSRVILTPASDSKHIVHVDDVSNDNLKKMQDAGFKPAAIIETSPNKHNVILTVERDKTLTPEQQKDIHKEISQALNKQFGDPEARNATQPFRAPGFENRKAKYQDANGQFPKITLKFAERRNCTAMQSMFQNAAVRARSQPQPVRDTAARPAPVTFSSSANSAAATKAYFAHVKSIRKDANAGKLPIQRRKDGSLDQTAVDVLAAQRMKMTGWPKDQIAQAITDGCNTVRAQNGDKQKYGEQNFGRWAAAVADKVDLTGMGHQLKYRIKDEAAAGITSPIVAEKNKELEKLKEPEQAKEKDNEQTQSRDKPAQSQNRGAGQQRDSGRGGR